MTAPEIAHKPLPVNRYVIFKNSNVFYEGRIVDVLVDGNKTLYSVVSFATFEYFRVTESELVTQSSHESKKKYKPSTNCENFNNVRMPSILRNRLRADKDYCIINYSGDGAVKTSPGVTVKRVIQDFGQFFQQNSLLYETSEINEALCGFMDLFNTFLPITLLYESEKTSLGATMDITSFRDYTNDFGPVHLLRLLYFIQKHNDKFVKPDYTQLILSDYSVYLIDFLNSKYQEYFY